MITKKRTKTINFTEFYKQTLLFNSLILLYMKNSTKKVSKYLCFLKFSI